MTPLINQVKLWGARQNQRPMRSILMFLPILLITGVVIVGFSLIILQLSNMMPKPSTPSLGTLFGVTILFGSIITTAITSVYIWAQWLGYQGLEFIGLDSNFRMFHTGVLWGTSLQALAFLFLIASAELRIDTISFNISAIINVLIITLSSLTAGFVEEVLYRGVLYSAMRTRWGWWTTAVSTSAVFVLPHFISNTYDSLIGAALGLFAGGMLFAWAREVSRGLWIPIGIHFAWDAAIGWFNLTASKSPHLLMTTINAPTWLIGEWGVSDWITLFSFALSLWFFRNKRADQSEKIMSKSIEIQE